jgi:riboflavin synthase
MFTGLVEEIGEVVERAARDGGHRLRIACRRILEDQRPGDSVSVSGICLTLERIDREKGCFHAFAVGETAKRSTLDSWRRGTAVNLERALPATARLGGHIVQGHVDGVGRILRLARQGGGLRLHLGIAPRWRPLVAEKGSIAVDGVSLTVGRLTRSGCELFLVPETLRRTTLGRLRGGERVNVEIDLLARYVMRLVEAGLPRRCGENGSST